MVQRFRWAMTEISTRAPLGNPLTNTASRAGDRVDDTYFECTEREMMELEHQRHRNKKEDQKEKTK